MHAHKLRHRGRRGIAMGACALSFVAATTAASASAQRAATGGRGAGTFRFAPPVTGTTGAPSVAALASGSDIVAWVAYHPSTVGEVMLCRIDRGANGCAPGSSRDLGDGVAALPEDQSGFTPTVLAGANGEVVVLFGGSGTIALVSHDNGATFAAPVAISKTIVPDNAELTDGGSTVLIGGAPVASSNPSTFEFVDVPLDGSGLTTPAVAETEAGSSHYTLGLYNGKPLVAATTSSTLYGPSAVTWAYETGTVIDAAASWTVGTLPNEGVPSLATTASGLVLGALNVNDPKGVGQSYPTAAVFNGTSFSAPVTLSSSTSMHSTFLAAAGVAGPTGRDRYTVTWQVVGCAVARCSAFAVSSKNGKQWTKPTLVGPSNVYSANDSLSPDGGGLSVVYVGAGYTADRLYVGTALHLKTTRVRELPGRKFAFGGSLKTDLGAPVVKASIVLTSRVGRTVRKLGKVTTDKAGNFAVSLGFSSTTLVQFTYSGNALYDPSQAAAKYELR